MSKSVSVLFGQSSNGDRFLLGVHESETDDDKRNLRSIINNFREKLGGDVAIITTDINQNGLFKI